MIIFKFKDAKPGLFRSEKGLVYCKLDTSLVTKDEEMKTINAIQITSGSGYNFEPDDEVNEW